MTFNDNNDDLNGNDDAIQFDTAQKSAKHTKDGYE